MRLAHSMISIETRRKMSLSLKGMTAWNKGLTKETSPIVKIYSEKHSERMKGRTPWNKGKKGLQVGWSKGLTKENNASLKLISERMKGNQISEEARRKISLKRLSRVYPVKDTKIEKALQKGLDDLGIKYEKHIPVCGICQPDIVIPEKRISIFADGNYWHNLPSYKVRDARQNKVLEENGWKVIRFWEHEINNNLSSCINKIVKEVS